MTSQTSINLSAYQFEDGASVVAVTVAGGSRIVHAGRKIGTYASGRDRYRKLCSTGGNDRHEPMPVGDDSVDVTCKRCLAKLSKLGAIETKTTTPATPARKWSVRVSVGGQDVTSAVEYGTSDTLREVTHTGVELATRMIRDEELGSDGCVELFKQRSTDSEPVRDRAIYVYRDEDGTIRRQH